MYKIVIFIIAFFSWHSITSAQSQELKNVDSYLKDYLSKIPVPGFSIVIVEEKEVKFSKAYGVERAGSPKPMSVNSPMSIGALGRGFTAMAIMQMVEQGKLDLDVPVIQYIPWFRTANKEFSDQITLRMCLSNTTGIPPQFESLPELDDDSSVDAFIKTFESHFIKRRPGMSHEFCDEGYSLAGLVLSKVSGMSYADYIEKHILKPLEMGQSTTDPSKASGLNIVYGHEMGLKECVPAIKGTTDANFAAAGSQFYASVSDLGHYMIALLNDGKFKNQQLLSAQSVQELFKGNTTFEGLGTMLGGNGIDIEYALGWMGMQIEERNILIHTGGNGKVASIIGINRDKNQAFAMLFNADVNNLDRFEYPGMENTVNNVIHLLNGEATTDFGELRVNLTNDEDFELASDQWSKYVGSYESFGQSNPFFKDMIVEVRPGKADRMELSVRQEKEFKGLYELDFTNNSSATLRNISQPRKIQFSIYPDGSIGGLYMFGTEFKKLNTFNESRYTAVQSPDGSISFQVPQSLQYSWNQNKLSGTIDKDYHIDIMVSEIKSQSFDSFISKILNGHTIKTKGILNKLSIKKGIWTEQTIVADSNGTMNQYLFAFYQDPISQKQMELVLTNRWGTFSNDLHELIIKIQKTVSLD